METCFFFFLEPGTLSWKCAKTKEPFSPPERALLFCVLEQAPEGTSARLSGSERLQRSAIQTLSSSLLSDFSII